MYTFTKKELEITIEVLEKLQRAEWLDYDSLNTIVDELEEFNDDFELNMLKVERYHESCNMSYGRTVEDRRKAEARVHELDKKIDELELQ